MASEMNTCAWAMHQPLEREYHDAEWGIVSKDDNYLFEFLTLEGAQAGLSWYTILKRRDAYKQAFDAYNLERLALYDEARTEEIITKYDVVKHRGKINSVFSNARAALLLQEEYGSLAAALWQFVDYEPVNNRWQEMGQIPVSTPESKAMSNFLKKRGFKFVGETICYAFMQAVGMVNDHMVSCPCYSKALASQAE
ncbi:DNA-3-methyladenine glycosylase I [uncultured Photobacterium sp.]|uniref:DNA-3-methyladenine glycosylase I n=1 Tax=uncultured Photobacterium sp. TaxID=173973 RepID=UPI002630ABC9|nr:DNA-3-methyladenine glycosylase I [uncultured Photobacterium sp.]